MRVLLVEDEKKLAEEIAGYLRSEVCCDSSPILHRLQKTSRSIPMILFCLIWDFPMAKDSI